MCGWILREIILKLNILEKEFGHISSAWRVYFYAFPLSPKNFNQILGFQGWKTQEEHDMIWILHVSSVWCKQPFRAAILFNLYPALWYLMSRKRVMSSEEQISKGCFWGAFLFQKCCQLAWGSGNEWQPGECRVWGRSGWALKKCKQAVIQISSKKSNSLVVVPSVKSKPQELTRAFGGIFIKCNFCGGWTLVFGDWPSPMHGNETLWSKIHR